jgi:hypothetical protein
VRVVRLLGHQDIFCGGKSILEQLGDFDLTARPTASSAAAGVRHGRADFNHTSCSQCKPPTGAAFYTCRLDCEPAVTRASKEADRRFFVLLDRHAASSKPPEAAISVKSGILL